MFRKDIKLPELKFLMEVDKNFQPVINFLESGRYKGDIYSKIQQIENLIATYNGNVLFKNSSILNNMEYFVNNISCFAHNGIVILTEQQLNDFLDIAKNIVKEYNQLMDQYMQH